MKPQLSIIVPCYNVQDYVQAALQSILDNLSPENDARAEIIIINDGATDQTETVIRAFLREQLAERAIVYRLINQDNAGLSAARNAGMRQAQGDYWLFLDSDDFFYNQSLDKILNIIDQHQPDIIEFDATKWTDGIFAEQSLYQKYFTSQNHRLDAFEANLWYVWSRCYHRKLFENQEFEVRKLFEDMMTIPYLYLAANQIFRLPESLLAYRQRSQSILATLSHRHLRDLFWGIGKAIEQEKNYPKQLKELTLLQYKNWRLIVAESVKIFLRSHDHSYLSAVQAYRAQMRQQYGRDYGWQFAYFAQVLIQKLFNKIHI